MSLLSVLAAVMMATMLIVGYLVFIWWLDRYEREPLWVVLVTFVWGALGGTVFSCIVNTMIGNIVTAVVGTNVGKFVTTVMVAPTVEELIKGLIFLPLVFLGNNIDNRTDGLIYGAAAGLGFSCLENLWYYANNFNPASPEALYTIIFMRTMFTSLVHCASSAMFGMAIGYARHRSGALRWIVWPAVGYFFAVLNHATWNALASVTGMLSTSAASLAEFTLLLGVAMVLGVVVVMFAITQASLHAEHKYIRRYLLEEAQRGVLPARHAEIIPYWLRRSRSDWLPSQIDKQAYIKAATLLAFRHHQLEIAQGERRQEYLEDIANYRRQVRGLLGG
ncbi:MAG: PrsW family intramembrane metalloprotease [Myxococcota bacterium]